jgi:hypothetical protein
MLNDIRLHLHCDEKAQRKTERTLANNINTLYAQNVKAFTQFVPSIGKIISQLPFERLSVFVDKERQFNLVDFQSGSTLYGPNVDINIRAQVNAWAYNSALLDVLSTESAPKLAQNKKQTHDFACRQTYAAELQNACKKIPIDTLVILGIGKAKHIIQLLDENVNPNALPVSNMKNVVIYEPDWEVFRCSLSVFDWSDLLAFADHCNLKMFFQIGTDIHNLFDDISELHQELNANRILFYKHINLPAYMHVIKRIQQGKWDRGVTQAPSADLGHEYHHLQVFSATNAQQYEVVSKSTPLFCSNMALFEEYFPDIHASFIDYQPLCWELVKDKTADVINLLNAYSGNFYANTTPKQEGEAMAQHFMQYPNVDGLVFGYEGDKLRHYLHNTFIRQADMILRENEESQGELPEEVKVLMMFGLGDGYMLDALYGQSGKHQKSDKLTKHKIQNLIICEPNPDFFYASLHALDWAPIFKQINDGEFKLYINIGESSSLLFKDLMTQFLVLGPHLLNQTFIAQAYHNPMLHQVMCEVRMQLKVIFAMGENFDHVAYGIAHTVKAMQNKIPALRHRPSQYLHHTNKQTPIFLVGNGPSLDESINIIKEYKGEAIVVSCGTALQALYKNGITPDFHGEVEQNRANFDWVSRINDREYLKKITLLSVNGIHPDTSSLYKNVLIAFKSGESSTHALLAMLPANSYHTLEHAYPTVTNMALSFFLSMGFEQLYLVGIDLGFADQSKHHSSASGYYENGKQIYDYQQVHAADLRVKGNRQSWVFTKTEFNISRMIIEQLLQKVRLAKTGREGSISGVVDCFNLSNGVFIEGTLPLDPESVLVVANKAQKDSTMLAMENCFMAVTSDVLSMINKGYQSDLLGQQMSMLVRISDAKIDTKEDIHSVITALSTLLKEAKRKGKSLFYYYFFNSVNYLAAALSKASLQSDEQLAQLDSKRLLLNWRVFLADAKSMLNEQFSLIDNAEAFGDKREIFLLEKHPTVRFFCANAGLANAMRMHIKGNAQSRLVVDDSVKSSTSVLTGSDLSSSLIIDIEKPEDILHYMPMLQNLRANNGLSTSVGLLFHDFALLGTFEKEYPLIAKDLCLLYCSPYIGVQQHKAERVKEGLQDFLLMDEFCHFIQARALDLAHYALVISKPKFSMLGLQNAYAYNEKNADDITFEALITSNMDGLQALGKYERSDYASVDKQAKYVANNEYDSVSVAVINQNIVPILESRSKLDGYMFKQYFAYTKNKGNALDSPCELSLSIVDSLENRGRLMNRVPLDFELMGPWQSADNLLPAYAGNDVNSEVNNEVVKNQA